jgi:hypothetical protein
MNADFISITKGTYFKARTSRRRQECSSTPVPCLCSTDITKPYLPQPNVIETSISSPLWEQPFPHRRSFRFNDFKYNFKSRMIYTYKYDCDDSKAGMRPAVCQPSWSDILTAEAYPLVISQGQTSLFTVGISTSHQLVQVYST